MKWHLLLVMGLLIFSVPVLVHAETQSVWLESIDLSLFSGDDQGMGFPGRRMPSIIKAPESENPFTIGETKYEHGIAVRSPNVMLFQLDGKVKNFKATVGVFSGMPNFGPGFRRPGGQQPGGQPPAGPDQTQAQRPRPNFPAPSLEFMIYADAQCVWNSGVLEGEASKEADVDLTGKKQLALVVESSSEEDRPFRRFGFAAWANAKFDIDGQPPAPAEAEKKEPYILTPKPGKTPRINGAKVFGARPGSPFLYTITATGERPMKFSTAKLPDGLTLDAETGRITGKVTKAGTFKVTLKAENKSGKDEREFRIVIGDAIALTPPLGWNSWNCWAAAVDAEKVKAAAKAMKESGLIDHGWTYINIDDAWQGRERGGKFNAIQGNEKFPDMKELCDYVHGLGLKIGIYSTPWTVSYAGYMGGSSNNEKGEWELEDYPQRRGGPGGGPGGPPMGGPGGASPQGAAPGGPPQGGAAPDGAGPGGPPPGGPGLGGPAPEGMGPGGSPPGAPGQGGPGMFGRDSRHGKFPFAKNDAQQWADWGFDYLKYDWSPNDVPHVEEMANALKESGRDVVYSLSNSAPFDQAGEWVRLSNCWRTTGDIRDTWQSMSGIGFAQSRWAPFAGPGHWNDPDMLVVGLVGWGPNLHPTSLTPDEQYTHISLWCLLSAPLLIGC
ncbi:MAG: NPCBM/NEW2 domain-containing protein, partial [Candidatus Omnitrophota bacterium]